MTRWTPLDSVILKMCTSETILRLVERLRRSKLLDVGLLANSLILAGIVVVASWLMVGCRAALLMLLSFGSMLGLDKLLRLLLFQARPSPALISVVKPAMKGSAFPRRSRCCASARSAMWQSWRWREQRAGRHGCRSGVYHPAGLGTARVALGAHWPGDVLVSHLYGFVWAGVLLYWIPARDQRAG